MRLKNTKEILEHLRQGVFVRLQCSPTHGIGVFAIRDIPAGIDPFNERANNMSFAKVPAAKILDNPEIPAAVKKYVEDMCISRGGYLFVPRRGMNVLPPVFYINHSKTPNVGADPEDYFYTLRPIEAGEELTVDYETYNDETGLEEG